VFTRGRTHAQNDFRSESVGDFTDGRVVLLVNQYSASASEILSGAIQDNDRGLVVGRRTFGKGLVQRPMPFPDGSMIRLTYSRYYTPSGRCIQKPYTSGDQKDYSEDMLNRFTSGELMHADSIHINSDDKYLTLHNARTVYGGGGIMPDLFVPLDTTTTSRYYRGLVAKGAINQFCIDYVDNNRKSLKKSYPDEVSFINGFEVTPDLMRGLVEWGVKEGVEYVDSDYVVSRPTLETIVKALIGSDLFGSATYYRIANTLNPIYREGLRLINDGDLYDRLLLTGRKD
jgi:carboxyl-terminal processing protease